MSRKPASPRATIEAWRAQQAHAMEPWRFHLIDALERRLANHTGATHQWLEARLRQLMDRYAEGLNESTDVAEKPATTSVSSAPARGPLGELADQFTQRPRKDGGQGDEATSDSAVPELPALDTFRKTWSRLHAQSQLQQVREQAPAHGGPLSSAILVHRSVTLMRSLSPDYLAHFLAYIDDLSWLEQLAGSASSTPATTRSGSARKRTRSKPKPEPRE
ncbi:DUF2894 domain-containing protein [Rhodanobacter glycinis]|uniref:DUF2894 domain-containing protein n=1 Tax=Rhodanobacter glycinis TaxID=582702 RepID=A0A5B9E332_9GAMM|nr:DUF2894 domain-containing protein [Rhodanobacter glycinis]QEE25385.1 DUF2894 domain-containing protein [Rhodanobacter glycinis]